jgi:hypothetical protein
VTRKNPKIKLGKADSEGTRAILVRGALAPVGDGAEVGFLERQTLDGTSNSAVVLYRAHSQEFGIRKDFHTSFWGGAIKARRAAMDHITSNILSEWCG